MTLKRLNAVLLVFGLVCFGWMLFAVGAGDVWRTLRSLGWGLVPLALIEVVGDVFHTAAWRRCLSNAPRHFSLMRLFWMRLAGYAVNYFTPTAAIGGEVARVSLIAAPGRAPEAASAVLIDKTAMAFAHLMLVVVGAGFLLSRVHLPKGLQAAMMVTGSLMAFGIITFALILINGRLGTLVRWFAARGRGGPRRQKLAVQVTAVDEAFRHFYRHRKKDLVLTVSLHFGGFVIGLLQAFWFFALAHQHPATDVVLAVWVLGLWFDLLVFAVPMSLGTLEASRVVTFVSLGYPAVDGMTYGMVLRLGQGTLAVLGLIGYAVLTFAPRNRLTSTPDQDFSEARRNPG